MRNSTFCCTGRGIYQLKIPLVIRIFMVGAVRCKRKKPLVQPTVPSAYEPSSCATKCAVSFGRTYTLRRGVVRIVRHSPERPGSTFCKLCGEITCCWCYYSFLSLSPLTNYCTTATIQLYSYTATATNYRHLLLLLTTQKRMRGARE
jgi:hypothetical protein